MKFIPDYYAPKYVAYQGDLVCCRHVLEHIERPREFLHTLREIIGGRSETIVYFEVPNVRTILRDMSVWTIIYEHCSYLSAESMVSLFVSCGFDVLDAAERFDGQFLGIEAKPSQGAVGDERFGSLADLYSTVRSFAELYGRKELEWRSRLEELRHNGTRVVAWGSGARTVGMFNTLRVDAAVIPYVVDINPRKHGRFVAGTAQEIVPPDFLREYRPSLVIVMNEIYLSEIRNQMRGMGVESDCICA